MESDVQEPIRSPEQLLTKYLPLPYRVAALIVLGKHHHIHPLDQQTTN